MPHGLVANVPQNHVSMPLWDVLSWITLPKKTGFVVCCASRRKRVAEHPRAKGSVAREPSMYGCARVILPTTGATILFAASAVALYKDAIDDVSAAVTRECKGVKRGFVWYDGEVEECSMYGLCAVCTVGLSVNSAECEAGEGCCMCCRASEDNRRMFPVLSVYCLHGRTKYEQCRV
jgi:hypothetical protein